MKLGGNPVFVVLFLYSFANNKNQNILQLLLLSNAVFPDVRGHELHQMLVKCYEAQKEKS